jgi:predicted RNA-binding Zn-ribbon protein involved in translation (DUF1610 family)
MSNRGKGCNPEARNLEPGTRRCPPSRRFPKALPTVLLRTSYDEPQTDQDRRQRREWPTAPLKAGGRSRLVRMGTKEYRRTCQRCGTVWYVAKAWAKDRPFTEVLGGLGGALLANRIGQAKSCPNCGSVMFQQEKASRPTRIPGGQSQSAQSKGVSRGARLLDNEVGRLVVCSSCGWKVPAKEKNCSHCGVQL